VARLLSFQHHLSGNITFPGYAQNDLMEKCLFFPGDRDPGFVEAGSSFPALKGSMDNASPAPVCVYAYREVSDGTLGLGSLCIVHNRQCSREVCPSLPSGPVLLIPVLPPHPTRSSCTQIQVAKAYIPLDLQAAPRKSASRAGDQDFRSTFLHATGITEIYHQVQPTSTRYHTMTRQALKEPQRCDTWLFL
jgi:hypothetical protein